MRKNGISVQAGGGKAGSGETGASGAAAENAPAPRSGAWVNDFLASVVVFLVALPLCMGIAIASGVPVAAGLITGIVGGLVVGFLAGSPLQVSGPAAGLAVIVWELVNQYGLATLGLIVALAGAIQLLAGVLRLGQWFRAVSPAVIQGMLAGIGVLIFASQFHVMIDDAPRGNGLKNLLSIPEAIWKAIVPPAEAAANHQVAAAVGVATIAAIILWQLRKPKRLAFLPAPLIAVVVAVALSFALGLNVNYVSVPANLLDAVSLPNPAAILAGWSWSILGAALALAFIASAETLLCATAVDQMHTGPRTRYDRELAAQGVGNLLAGVLGGLPMTGVIVRSAANVEAGAKTRRSAILHGVWLLAFVAAVPFVLELIPTAALAAILVFTGYKLVNPAAIRKLAQFGKAEVAIYTATVVGIVATDLLTGVIVGLALSLAKLVWTFTHLDLHLHEAEAGPGKLHLRGAATFVRLPVLAAALERVPPGSEIHLHFDELRYIDPASLELLRSWSRQHETTGGRIHVDWEELAALHAAPAGARSTNGSGLPDGSTPRNGSPRGGGRETAARETSERSRLQ